ncbi:MAG: hypothetical protein A2Y77_08810 [Planctomycetes bacterium RBG_13_62_9]|nr:MAG: hypothetical protein A2Y77_08810 [Planctomycetes bacterium RBG_13_62_9]
MVLFLLLASCDEMKRHKVLTFFFDGVPPPRAEASGTESSASNEKDVTVTPAAESWHVHEPLKDCTQCHGRQPRRGFSSKVQLVAEVPQLCYGCHAQYVALQGWVHGPVAAGDCLACHEPHKTRTESLLAKPVPELCYRCHEVQAIRTIERHAEESHAHCTDCHEGHASTTRALLRPSVVAAHDEPAATPAVAEDRRGDQERAAAELYYHSIKQYHAGQLRAAREGLLQALNSGLLPDPMRETVNAYLEKIDEALEEPPTE